MAICRLAPPGKRARERGFVRARDRGRVAQRPRDRPHAQGRDAGPGLHRRGAGERRRRPRGRQHGRLHRHHGTDGAGAAAAGADRRLSGRAGGVRRRHAHPAVEPGRGTHLRLASRRDDRAGRAPDGTGAQTRGERILLGSRHRRGVPQRPRDRSSAQGRHAGRRVDRGRSRPRRVGSRRRQHGRLYRDHRAQGAGGRGASPQRRVAGPPRGPRRVARADRHRRRRRAAPARAQSPRRRAAAARHARPVAAARAGQARFRSGDRAHDADRGRDELVLALEELRELARGLHPAVLTDHGLGAAVEMLAGRAPMPSRSRQCPRRGSRSPSRRRRTT